MPSIFRGPLFSPRQVPRPQQFGWTQDALGETLGLAPPVGQSSLPASIPRRQSGQITVAVNLLLTVLAVAETPFFETEWPNPPQAARAQDVGYVAGKIPQDVPFFETEWPNPNYIVPRETPGQVSGVIPQDIPFFETEWPNPNLFVPRETQRGQVSGVIPQGVPFFETEWPNPIPNRTNDTGYVCGLTPPEDAPFAKLDWDPLPSERQRAPAHEFSVVPPEKAPFSQLDWPNPDPSRHQARPGYTTGIFPPPQAPFSETEWPNPQEHRPTDLGYVEGISPSKAPVIEIGITAIQPNNDSGNANRIQSQLAVLSQPGTIQTISYYVVTAAGNIRLAVYDDTGTAGGPGALVAETASTAAVGPNTWNVLPVIAPVLMQPGNYWLSWQNSSGSLVNKWLSSQGTSAADNGFAYAAYPSTYTIDSTGTGNWSISAQLTPSSVDNPFTAVDFPNPEVRRPLNVGFTQDIFRNPQSVGFPFLNTWPIPRAHRHRELGYQQGIRPPDQVPIYQPEFPNPRGFRQENLGFVSGIFMNPPDVGFPFSQDDWPNPRAEEPTDLGYTRRIRLQEVAIPFQQTEWPDPQVRRDYDPSFTSRVFIGSLPQGLTPFSQLDWPNPIERDTQGTPLGYTSDIFRNPAAPGAPFRQREWANPEAAVTFDSSGLEYHAPTILLYTPPVVVEPPDETEALLEIQGGLPKAIKRAKRGEAKRLREEALAARQAVEAAEAEIKRIRDQNELIAVLGIMLIP